MTPAQIRKGCIHQYDMRGLTAEEYEEAAAALMADIERRMEEDRKAGRFPVGPARDALASSPRAATPTFMPGPP